MGLRIESILSSGTCCLLLGWLATGCATPTSPPEKAAWGVWRERRHESIAGTNGWLTLAGLYWLREGDNTVGSDPTHSLVLPAGKAPRTVGTLVRSGDSVWFHAAGKGLATVGGEPVGVMRLQPDTAERPTVLEVGSLKLTVLDRGERVGLRVRDPDSADRRVFGGLTYFPYDPAWRLEGRFKPSAEGRILRVQDVTGGMQELTAAGEVVFQYEGAEHRLEAVQERGEDDLFVIFRDRTAGDATYGPGRYLYVERPTSGDRVVVDFNRAYNPPCAFTPYATCPLPPRRNWLPFAIRAGERRPEGSH